MRKITKLNEQINTLLLKQEKHYSALERLLVRAGFVKAFLDFNREGFRMRHSKLAGFATKLISLNSILVIISVIDRLL